MIKKLFSFFVVVCLLFSFSPVANAIPAAGSNSQAQFNDNGNIGADAGLAYDKVNDILSLINISSVPGNLLSISTIDDISPDRIQIISGNAESGDNAGADILIRTGNGFGTAAGGGVSFVSGTGGATGTGGLIELNAGSGGAISGAGGPIVFVAGSAQGTNSSGGDISFEAGAKTGSGTKGRLLFRDGGSTVNAIFDTASLATSDKTFTFPNSSGIFALTLNNLSVFASTTSAQLAGLITDETGSGPLVLANAPVLSGAVTGATSYNGLVITPNTGVVTTGTWNGGIIQIAYGGTNGTATPTAGALAYGTGSAYAFTGAGTSGQILQSSGTSAPAWSGATYPATASSAGNYLRSDGTNFVSTAITQSQSTPADPGATTSTTGVMMGLAGSITPSRSGKVLIVISGDVDNNTAGNGSQFRIRYGTGSAPLNGSALTGATAGALQKFVNPSLALLLPGRSPFSVNAIVIDLTVNTSYCIDLELGAITGGTATVRDVSMSIIEL